MKLLLHLKLTFLLGCLCLPVMSQNDAGYVWRNVKMGGGGFVSGIITTPAEQNLIYARTDVGGAYRWEEGSKSWIPLLDWTNINQTSYQGVEAMAIDPSSPNKLYISVGTEYWNGGISAILRSEDYGNTFSITNVTSQFKVHGNGMGRQTGERLAVDPNKGDILFCGTRIHGLFRSDNAGQTWTKVTSFPATPTGSLSNVNGIGTVVFDPSSATTGEATQRIFAAISRVGSDNLFVSEDGGETWSPVEGAVNNLMIHRMILEHGHLFMTYVNDTGPWNIGQTLGAVYKYNIAEKTWHNITPAPNTPYAGITVDHQHPDTLMVSTINIWNAQNWINGTTVWGDRIYRSTDGGNTWTSLFAASKITLDPSNVWDNMSMHWVGDIKIDPFNSDRVFTVSGNGIFMTSNISEVNTGKSTWFLQTENLEETVPGAIVSIPGGPAISVIYDYDGFVHNSVYLPGKRHAPGVGSSTGLDFAQNNTSFVVRSGGDDKSDAIYYSTDQGKTWTKFASKPVATAKSGYVAVSANGDKVIWKPDGVNNVYFTTNRGTTWQTVSDAPVSGRPVSDRINNEVFYIYAGTQLKVFTFNQSLNRYDVENINIGFSGRDLIRTVPNREGEIWLANNDSGLRRFNRSGNSITKITGVTACRAVGFGKAPAGKDFPAVFIWGIVGGVEGIFRSDDEGATWMRINDDNHQYGGPGNAHFINGDANVFGRVYMSTVGRGIVMGYPEGETSVEEPAMQIFRNKPQSAVLFQNSFTVTSEAPEAIYQVYNLAGILVDQGAFSGSTEIGAGYPEGMYILSVSTYEGREIRRIFKKD